MENLRRIALILLLTVAFFAMLTQRMLLFNDGYNHFIDPTQHQTDIPIPMEMKKNTTKLRNIQKIHQLYKGNASKIAQAIQEVHKQAEERYNLHFVTTNEELRAQEQGIYSTPSTTTISSTSSITKPTKMTSHASKSKTSSKPEVISKIKELPIYNYHPKISPRQGTDISYENQMKLLSCKNQSLCIIPELQLKEKYKIYFCKHPTRTGVRFYYLIREGLHLHPNVELVTEENIHQADYIIYLPGSAPWHLTECTNRSYSNRLIVLDEFDGSSIFAPTSVEEYKQIYGKDLWYHMYFKRSYVSRRDGRFLGHIHMDKPFVYPITYAIAELYVPFTFNHKREINILCTLRGSKHMTTRLRVQEWVAEYGKSRDLPNVISGQVCVTNYLLCLITLLLLCIHPV